MDRKKIVEELAPCGLDCSRCAQYGEGNIKKLSAELSGELEHFSGRAEKMAAFAPEFKDYAAFEKILDFFSEVSCPGCRERVWGFPDCAAKDCTKEKQIDFCFQCDEFPCERNSYPEELREKWLRNNQKMKEEGLEQFYREQKSRPRY